MGTHWMDVHYPHWKLPTLTNLNQSASTITFYFSHQFNWANKSTVLCCLHCANSDQCIFIHWFTQACICFVCDIRGTENSSHYEYYMSITRVAVQYCSISAYDDDRPQVILDSKTKVFVSFTFSSWKVFATEYKVTRLLS